MTRILLLFIVAATTVCSLSAAAIVHLKTGMDVRGSIVEKQADYIVINFYGVTLRYWYNEIDRIEEKIGESGGNDKTKETSGTFKKASARLIAQGDYTTAIKILTELEATGSHTSEVHNDLAIAYACSGDLSSAVSQLKEALTLESGDAETEIIRYNLAYVYTLANRIDDARREYDKLKSDNLRILLKRVRMTRENGMGANMI
ncbi:MAG: hypothetical protein KKF80_05340, partial [Candidatus Omnitrophica bacterium]|nr:hypothetical protein [Candidatus Omnitrophota bacterium]